MHVLHVAPSVSLSYGGPTQALAGYVRAAASAGIETTIAAPFPDDNGLAFLKNALPTAQFELFPSFGSGALVASPQLLRFLWGAAKRFDVVHVHGLLNSISSGAIWTCRRKNVPVIVRPFGTLSRYTFSYRRSLLKRAYFRVIDRANVRGATAVHFTTATERDEAALRVDRLGQQCFVVPPPFTNSRSIGSKGTAGRDVVLVARLHPVKNVELLIAAWPRVVAAAPHARLRIAGRGDAAYVQSLHAMVHVLNLASSVEFLGFADEPAKRQLYADAAIAVLPSHHENFGVAAVEALAFGVPVVVTRQVQFSDTVERWDLGCVVDPDPGQLADALLSLLADDARRAGVRQRAAAMIESELADSVIGQQLRAMYESVARPSSTNRIA